MISDPLAIAHTVIDPNTESIQMIGRFREPVPVEGEDKVVVVKDIYHVSNYNSKLTSFSNTEIDEILEDTQRFHTTISSFKATSNIQYISSLSKKILEIEEFAYYYRDGKSNHFMMDNFRDKELIKSHYKTSKGLVAIYTKLERFKVHSESGYKHFVLSDADLRDITTQTATSKVNTFVGLRLKELMETEMDEAYRAFNLEMIKLIYPKQMAVIDKITLLRAAKLDYDFVKIEQYQNETLEHDKLDEIREFSSTAFELKGYTSNEIHRILTDGINKTDLKGYKPDASLLRLLAKLSTRKRIKQDHNHIWLKGYEIIRFYD